MIFPKDLFWVRFWAYCSLFLSELSYLRIILCHMLCLTTSWHIRRMSRLWLIIVRPSTKHRQDSIVWNYQNFSRCFGCKVITPTSSMNQLAFGVINLLRAREKCRVECAIKRNNRGISFESSHTCNLSSAYARKIIEHADDKLLGWNCATLLPML